MDGIFSIWYLGEPGIVADQIPHTLSQILFVQATNKRAATNSSREEVGCL